MPQGTVKFFDTDKGYGFIVPDDGSADVFVHQSVIEAGGLPSLEENQRVEFTLNQDSRNRQADQVQSISAGAHSVPPGQGDPAESMGNAEASMTESSANPQLTVPVLAEEFPPRSSPLTAEDPRGVGQYRILRRLGQGAMGMVYLGKGQDGRNVAIKVVRPELARDRVFLQRFDAEAQYACRVDATYTARVIAAVTDVEHPYLVTEFIDGPTLDEQVSRVGRLHPWDAKALAIGMAAALIAIHDAGLVHRDLKPANVMLSHFGPRVIDFGIARSLSAATATRLTQTGSPVGTPAYMSPEQIQDEEVTSASDIFSWAGVMVYATTGHQPFGSQDANAWTVFFQILDEKPRIADVPAELHELLTAALNKDATARPTARQLLAHLTGSSSVADPDALASSAINATVGAKEATTAPNPHSSPASGDQLPVAPADIQPFTGHDSLGTTDDPGLDSPVDSMPSVAPTPVLTNADASAHVGSATNSGSASAEASDAVTEPIPVPSDRITKLLEGGPSQPDHLGYAQARSALTLLPVSSAANVLSNLSPSSAATIVQDIGQDHRLWVITVLEAMPEEKARQLLLSMNFKKRYELSLPQSLMRLLRETTVKSRSRAMGRSGTKEGTGMVNDRDPESLAAQVDRLSPDEAARTIRRLDPELSDRVLDLVGTRKARSIRRYL